MVFARLTGCRLASFSTKSVVEKALWDEGFRTFIFGGNLVDRPRIGEDDGTFRQKIAIIPIVLDRKMRHARGRNGTPSQGLGYTDQ